MEMQEKNERFSYTIVLLQAKNCLNLCNVLLQYRWYNNSYALQYYFVIFGNVLICDTTLVQLLQNILHHKSNFIIFLLGGHAVILSDVMLSDAMV